MSRPALQTSALAGLGAGTVADAITRLTTILEALPTCGDPQLLADLAGALPATVAALEPEVCLALQAIAVELIPHGPVLPRDLDLLEPRLRIAWRRVALATADPAAIDRLDENELLLTVHGWSVDLLLDPRPLLQRLSHARDPRLRARLLDWIDPAVAQLALTPAEAFALLVPLSAGPDPTIRGRALAMLGHGWLRRLSPAAERERALLVARALEHDDLEVTRPAIATAAALGQRDPLLELALTEARPAQARIDALDALASLAEDADLEPVLTLALGDPLCFGAPARRFILAAHRRGVFLRAAHLGPLLAAFDAHPVWTGEELVRVTHIVRHELVEQLATCPADDPRWLRRAAILGASVGTRAPLLLRERLERVTDIAVAEALIDAAGRSPEYRGEAPLLAWLDRLPERVLPVLRVKGGPLAEQRLRARIDDPRAAPTSRADARDVLWSLSSDRTTLLRQLSAAHGPFAAGLLDRRRLTQRDPTIAAILADAPWHDLPHHRIDLDRRLEILCESGDIERMPQVVALFRDSLRHDVQQALDGDFTVKRTALPALEQKLFRYGRHLIAGGRSVRRWLEAAPETGRDLVLQLAIDWLLEAPADPVCVALLELIGRHAPGPVALRFIEPLWRHRAREVRRAAIEAILAAGENARGLELSLCRLADHDEPRILCQALAAIATLRAAWAEPIVLAALQRPEMAVKKAAAHALAVIGGPRSIAALVEWLAHHDNRGLRSELQAALRHAAGPSHVAVLVDALEHETDPRRIDLLHDALSAVLPLAAARRLARSARPAHRRLLGACLDGRVTLADADTDALAAQLHRLRLLPKAPRPDPGQRLRVEGFSPDAARALVAEHSPALEPAILDTIRLGLADWLAWLCASDPIDPRPLALVLLAAQPEHREQLGALLDCAERAHATLDPAAFVAFLERCLAGRAAARVHEVRAIALLRRLPRSPRVDGYRRHALLGRLGAVRTRADLERCLEESPLATRAILCDAFKLDAPHNNDRALTALREQAERWHTLDPAAQAAWLTTMLATRPLDLPSPEPAPTPERSPFQPHGQADLDSLLLTMSSQDTDEQERSRAAARLLDWPDAHPVWPQILDLFLHNKLNLGARHQAQIAPLMHQWPADPAAHPRARDLLPHCAPRQRREFVRAWIEAWQTGDPTVTDLIINSTHHEHLLPHLWSAAERGDHRLLRSLKTASPALRPLIEHVAARSPADVTHLMPSEPAEAPDAAAEPADPIAGRDPDALLALIESPGVIRGLAVRATHALVAHGERGIAPLERLVVDPRPQVRSAALRALRRVATRDATMRATAQALAIETRGDVILQLLKSLGHGRHEPALAAILERFEHANPRLRGGARDALRGWGHDVLPALRRAARRARPDRRPAYHDLIAELELLDP